MAILGKVRTSKVVCEPNIYIDLILEERRKNQMMRLYSCHALKLIVTISITSTITTLIKVQKPIRGEKGFSDKEKREKKAKASYVLDRLNFEDSISPKAKKI